MLAGFMQINCFIPKILATQTLTGPLNEDLTILGIIIKLGEVTVHGSPEERADFNGH
jgi:hypothetical protein